MKHALAAILAAVSLAGAYQASHAQASFSPLRSGGLEARVGGMQSLHNPSSFAQDTFLARVRDAYATLQHGRIIPSDALPYNTRDQAPMPFQTRALYAALPPYAWEQKKEKKNGRRRRR